MRAVRFDQHGDVDVLYVADVPTPTVGPGRVLLEVRACGLSSGESAIRRGEAQEAFPLTFPSGQGWNCAGVVTALGDGVDSVAVGEEVIGWSFEHSAQAEQVALPADQVVAKPPQVSWEAAGSMFVLGSTAYAAARAVAAGPGETVVVSAAAGSVGTLVVQLLRRAGAEVIALASDANHEWLRSIGASPLSHGDGLQARLRRTAPDGIDAFVDCFGDGYCQLALDVGVDPRRVNTIVDFAAAQRLGVKAEASAQAATPQVIGEVAGLVAHGELQVPIAATYSLEEVREAYADLERRHTRGTIVLVP